MARKAGYSSSGAVRLKSGGRPSELADVVVMRRPVARGEEPVERLADHLVGTPAEQLLRARAEQADALPRVDGDDRVGRGGDDRP